MGRRCPPSRLVVALPIAIHPWPWGFGGSEENPDDFLPISTNFRQPSASEGFCQLFWGYGASHLGQKLPQPQNLTSPLCCFFLGQVGNFLTGKALRWKMPLRWNQDAMKHVGGLDGIFCCCFGTKLEHLSLLLQRGDAARACSPTPPGNAVSFHSRAPKSLLEITFLIIPQKKK